MSKHEDSITIGLLSHYFTDSNLGCVALSICNIQLIDKAAKECGIRIKYIVYVNEKQPHWSLDEYTPNSYEYRVFSSCKASLKHPMKLLKTHIFDGCDVVFNLCAGDGFTDIYGFGRVLSETYMTVIASLKGSDVVLSPQTIGPFNGRISRYIAKHTLSRCEHVYTRDSISARFCRELGYSGPVEEVIDVAFVLPFSQRESLGSNQKPAIGLNVSGLLYSGGYNRKNYFGLSFDYKEYIHQLMKALLGQGYSVHLVSHVVTQDASIEDDYVACRLIKDAFPEAILMPRSESPVEVKSYISGLDAFVGARMHSTIGAFSAGVPVIPIAYSRKVNGLYDTLGYPYYIDALSGIDSFTAVNKTVSYINKRTELGTVIERCRPIYEMRILEFESSLSRVLLEVMDKK